MRKLIAFLLLLCLVLPLFAAPRRHAAGGEEEGGFSLWRTIFAYGFILQIAAIVTLARRGGDRYWIWLILIGGVIGAAAYFLVEGLPDFSKMRSTFAGPARRRRIQVLRAIIRDNPAAGNYEELGELLSEEKKWADAREAFDHALAQRTDSIDPFYRRGIASFHIGDDASAVRDLKLVVAKEPKYDYSRALCVLSQALARGGHTPEAVEAFDRLIRTSTAAESLCAAAEFLISQGRYAEARDLAESILDRRLTMPHYQKRRDRRWLWKAKGLLRRARKMERAPQPATA
ncbi:MAG TPA: hypothetical protein VJ276_00620 [Thermoanaerobaculia bacterium]|nr:hypothetical protein [Thermoanaerobaculia bacterium]